MFELKDFQKAAIEKEENYYNIGVNRIKERMEENK